MEYVSPTIEPLGGEDLVKVQGTWLVGPNHVFLVNLAVAVNVAAMTNAVAAKTAAVALLAAFWVAKANYIRD